MSYNTRRTFQDIAFFHIEKSPPPRKARPLLFAAVCVLLTVILLGIGFFVGVKTGAIAPACCTPLEFDFEFSL